MNIVERDTVGQYDPCTLIGCCTEARETGRLLDTAYGRDLLLVFTTEALLAGDEWRVRRDRFGRTLAQPEVIRTEVFE